MKRILLPTLAILLTSCPLYAESLTSTTYYPAPFGAYDRLRLVPRPALTGSCDIDTMYVESPAYILKFCRDGGGGIGDWGPWEVWTQSDNDIYPTDSTNPNLLKQKALLNWLYCSDRRGSSIRSFLRRS